MERSSRADGFMRRLDGRHILVAEDDVLVAGALCRALSELGATIIGPAATVPAALHEAAATALDAALLDVDLGGAFSYPVADLLLARRVPFVLATATAVFAMPTAYWHLPREEKPFCATTLATRIAALCAASDEAPLPPFAMEPCAAPLAL